MFVYFPCTILGTWFVVVSTPNWFLEQFHQVFVFSSLLFTSNMNGVQSVIVIAPSTEHCHYMLELKYPQCLLVSCAECPVWKAFAMLWSPASESTSFHSFPYFIVVVVVFLSSNVFFLSFLHHIQMDIENADLISFITLIVALFSYCKK